MRRRIAALVAAVAATVVVLDQVTKALVRSSLGLDGRSIEVVGSLVRLVQTRNSGAAFGMLPGNRFIFIGVSVVVVIGIVAYVWRYRPTRLWIAVALGLVAGGASGNLIDRVVIGMVTDFVQIPFDFPVFNVADSGIVVGVSMLVWWLLFGPAPAVPDPEADTATDAAADAASRPATDDSRDAS